MRILGSSTRCICEEAAATAQRIIAAALGAAAKISVYSFRYSSANMPGSARSEGLDNLRRTSSSIVTADGEPVGALPVHVVLTTPWLVSISQHAESLM